MPDLPIELLPSIYDASINPEIWLDVLDRASDTCGARGSTLIAVENGGDIQFHVDMRSERWRQVSDEQWSYYMDNFFHLEKEAWAFFATLPKQHLLTDDQLWTNDEELKNRPDYRYLLDTVGVFRKAGARLNDNPSWFDNIAFQFDSRHTKVPSSSLDSIRFLLPHLSKAVEIGRTFSMLKAKYNAVLGALDFIEVGICIALQSKAVIISNQEANRILSEQDGLTLTKDKRFKVRDAEMSAELSRAIEDIAKAALGKDSVAERTLLIQRSNTDLPLIVEVSPIRDTDNEIDSDLSGALILLIDPSTGTSVNTERVSSVFGLTQSEGEVCRHLIDGSSNAEIAETRNVSLDTVKSQVASILRKTGTTRRSELVRLALAICPPIKAPSIGSDP